MASSPAAGPSLSRRSFLGVSAVGLALLATGCTAADSGGQEPVTADQVDSLADQVTVQETLVAAYAAAAAADPALGRAAAGLADQAVLQLERLRAASPGAGASTSASASASVSAPAVGPDSRSWLREQVGTAADSHAAACLDQSGARAALLGSIAAGLRGSAVLLG